MSSQKPAGWQPGENRFAGLQAGGSGQGISFAQLQKDGHFVPVDDVSTNPGQGNGNQFKLSAASGASLDEMISKLGMSFYGDALRAADTAPELNSIVSAQIIDVISNCACIGDSSRQKHGNFRDILQASELNSIADILDSDTWPIHSAEDYCFTEGVRLLRNLISPDHALAIDQNTADTMLLNSMRYMLYPIIQSGYFEKSQIAQGVMRRCPAFAKVINYLLDQYTTTGIQVPKPHARSEQLVVMRNSDGQRNPGLSQYYSFAFNNNSLRHLVNAFDANPVAEAEKIKQLISETIQEAGTPKPFALSVLFQNAELDTMVDLLQPPLVKEASGPRGLAHSVAELIAVIYGNKISAEAAPYHLKLSTLGILHTLQDIQLDTANGQAARVAVEQELVEKLCAVPNFRSLLTKIVTMARETCPELKDLNFSFADGSKLL